MHVEQHTHGDLVQFYLCHIHSYIFILRLFILVVELFILTKYFRKRNKWHTRRQTYA